VRHCRYWATRAAHEIPLIPLPLRPVVAVSGAGMALIILVLGLIYHDTSSAAPIDTRIASAIAAHIDPDQRILRFIVRLGDPLSIAAIVVVLTMTALLLKRPRAAVLALVGPSACGVAIELMKPLVGRTYHGILTFPSGHTTGITAVATVAAVMAVSFTRSRLFIAIAMAVAGVLIVAIVMAFALLAQHLHYPTDTLGGFLTAMVIVLAGAFCIDAISTCGKSRTSHPHSYVSAGGTGRSIRPD
jgi:membrane-associated phospholipid phosphatase